MAIFKTAYDTSACSGFRTREVKDKLEAGRFLGAFSTDTPFSLKTSGEQVTLQLLKGGNSAADVVPFFNHPFPLKASNGDASSVEFALDVRNFGKWYAPNETFVVRNRPEYLWSVRRAVLNALWLTERPEIFRDLSTIPAAVYAGLISESIARRFALDAAEQITLSVVACYFYHCLFTDEKEFDEFTMNKVAGNIARITRAPAEKVFEIISDMKVLNSLDELCTACREKTGSVRLEDFNLGVLVAICSSTWFGTNAREILVVGLEHIPTWLAIVSASLNDATFKRSTLTKISTRYDKGGAAANFGKSLEMLIGGEAALHDALGLV
jgi:hypothetical protein